MSSVFRVLGGKSTIKNSAQRYGKQREATSDYGTELDVNAS